MDLVSKYMGDGKTFPKDKTAHLKGIMDLIDKNKKKKAANKKFRKNMNATIIDRTPDWMKLKEEKLFMHVRKVRSELKTAKEELKQWKSFKNSKKISEFQKKVTKLEKQIKSFDDGSKKSGKRIGKQSYGA